MTFQRDLDSAPRLRELLEGAGLLWAVNLALLGVAFLVAREAAEFGGARSVEKGAIVVLLFLGLLQWVYVVPWCIAIRARRGVMHGVLLGALLFTLTNAGCLSLFFVLILPKIPD